MFSPASIRRAAPRLHRAIQQPRRRISNQNSPSQPSEFNWGYAALAVAGGTAAYWGIKVARGGHTIDAEAAKEASDILSIIDKPQFEGSRPKAATEEENRELISSQHVQVKRSWENPGVYAWGLNSGGVVAPDSDERYIKVPRRISCFDGILLRDIKLDKDFGVAINEQGDLLQWGTGYAPGVKLPEVTLKGKGLRSLAISEDRIIALSDNGSVYSVPVPREEQQKDPKLTESSWFWSKSTSSVACRSLTPTDLGIGERVTSISGGARHVLMLTSRGRVFSAASSTRDYPDHGQLGIPGLSWYTRTPGPFDQPHEIRTLKGLNIKQIAAGDSHSLVLDSYGQAFSFGDNSHGQLGHDFNASTMNLDNALNITPHVIDIPTLVPFKSLYQTASQSPIVKTIAAGGNNSYFVVESKPSVEDLADRRKAGTVVSDAWSCGRGIWGTLGNGKWTHIQWQPARIPTLSGLSEYNEQTGRAEPIRVGSLSVGESHVAAVMANITRVTANSRSGENDTNYGSDVFFFGSNENFQLGTGKRTNLTIPTYIQPLGIGAKSTSAPGMQVQRLQITPGKKITFAGRSVWVEQKVECGRQCTAVYSAVL